MGDGVIEIDLGGFQTHLIFRIPLLKSRLPHQRSASFRFGAVKRKQSLLVVSGCVGCDTAIISHPRILRVSFHFSCQTDQGFRYFPVGDQLLQSGHFRLG